MKNNMWVSNVAVHSVFLKGTVWRIPSFGHPQKPSALAAPSNRAIQHLNFKKHNKSGQHKMAIYILKSSQTSALAATFRLQLGTRSALPVHTQQHPLVHLEHSLFFWATAKRTPLIDLSCLGVELQVLERTAWVQTSAVVNSAIFLL